MVCMEQVPVTRESSCLPKDSAELWVGVKFTFMGPRLTIGLLKDILLSKSTASFAAKGGGGNGNNSWRHQKPSLSVERKESSL